MDLVCGLDIETTGLDMNECEITEIAWVIKPWRDPKPLVMRSSFCRISGAVPDEITDLTGITDEHLQRAGEPLHKVLGDLADDLVEHDVAYILAHNGKTFDRPWLEKAWKEHSLFPPEALWLDSKADIRWPFASNKLTYLAAELGFLNPFPHAALFDVMTMFKVAETRHLSEIVLMAKEPDVVVEACVSYQSKDLAKQKQYRWQEPGNGKTYYKKWVKLIKEFEFDDEAKDCLFPVRRIECE